MYNFLSLSHEEKTVLISNTAKRKNISPAMVEKDFWVCLTLDYLFNTCKWKDNFIFKGGTSLSKVYHLIDRFSDDIDLILDWRVLGYSTQEPWNDRSNTQQQKFILDSREKLYSFLKDEFLPIFKNDMSEILHTEINAHINNIDEGTVDFVYPSIYSDPSILNAIRLEIGALAAWKPFDKQIIHPYIVDYYPNVFIKPSTEVLATTAERTFWEKATILHQEAFRPENSTIPARYSRHYYDLYCMINSSVKNKAIQDSELLEEVALFKKTFYPRGWARYDLATIGTLKLFPATHSIPLLKKDYEIMKSMIYGNYPEFDHILEVIKEFEETINKKM